MVLKLRAAAGGAGLLVLGHRPAKRPHLGPCIGLIGQTETQCARCPVVFLPHS
ncbi:hypothetical protein KY5_7202 [Streptomyces formicae]|uniref:UspA domain-containing protein n=1 Tax=Streptomyces formicae TaxID=1616117 RepID=A0A291QK72_9ACTN|nr:hypothetical protein KY5_7202 [Streptomyces formicae]